MFRFPHWNFPHLNASSLLLAGVFAQLAGSVARTVWKKPAQQAQIDRIEAKVSDALDFVTTLTQNTQTRQSTAGASTVGAGDSPGSAPTSAGKAEL